MLGANAEVDRLRDSLRMRTCVLLNRIPALPLRSYTSGKAAFLPRLYPTAGPPASTSSNAPEVL